MRKITLFFALMLTCVGTAMAQWSGKGITSVSSTPTTELADGYYVIYNNGRGTFLNSEGALGQAKVTWPTSASYSGVEALNSNEALTNSGAQSKNAYVFYVNVEGNKLSLQTGYNDYVPVLTSNTTFNYVSEEAFWNYTIVGEGFVFLKGETVGLDCNGWSASSHTYSTAAGWTADESHNTEGNQSWTFYAVTLGDATVCEIIYNYYDGSTLIKSETKSVNVGDNYPAATTGLPSYVAVTGIPEGKVSASGTYDLQCSLSESFPFNNTFGLSTRGGAKWLVGSEEGQALSTTPFTLTNLADANVYSWTLEGKWYEGFNLKHKGTNKYLAAPSENPGDGVAAVLQNTVDDLAKFEIVQNGGNYYIKFYGTDNNYVSDYGGASNASLKFWNSAWNIGDAGSIFQVENVDADALLAEFKNANSPIAGYVGAYDATAEEINALTLETVGDFINTTGKVAFAPDAYYRIKNVKLNSMLTVVAGERKPAAGLDMADVAQIWTFETAEEGSYKLKSLNYGANGYMQNPGAADALTTTDAAGVYAIRELGDGQFNLHVEGTNLVDYGKGLNDIGSWSDNPKGSDGAWYLIPATDLEVDITAAGWATTHLPFDVQIPANLKAYAVSAVTMDETEGSATLVEKTSIPANEGAILEGAQGTYTLKIAQAEAWTGNKLEGSNVNTYIEGSAYVLGIPEGETEAMFAKAVLNKDADGNDGTTHFLNNANKAYLPMINNASAQTLRFNFGETTGIEGIIEGTNANAVIFDLSGRRVAKMQKGIYIVNGKKVYVK